MTLFLIMLFVLICGMAQIFTAINWRKIRQNLFKRKVYRIEGLFANNFISSHVLFSAEFNRLANISLVKEIDTSKAYALLIEKLGAEIIGVYQYNTFDYNENQALFNVTIFVIKNERLVELGCNYAEVFYAAKHYGWANSLLSDLAGCKVEERVKVMGFVRPEVMN